MLEATRYPTAQSPAEAFELASADTTRFEGESEALQKLAQAVRDGTASVTEMGLGHTYMTGGITYRLFGKNAGEYAVALIQINPARPT